MSYSEEKQIRNQGGTNNYTFRMIINETVDEDTNTSTLSATLAIKGYTSQSYTGHTEVWGIQIGDEVRTGSNSNKSCSTSYHNVGTLSGSFVHDEDGTLTLPVRGWMTVNTSASYLPRSTSQQAPIIFPDITLTPIESGKIRVFDSGWQSGIPYVYDGTYQAGKAYSLTEEGWKIGC